MFKRVLLVSLMLLEFRCVPCPGFGSANPEPWIEIRSDHFRLLTDAGEKQGRQTIDQFERMRWVFQTLFPTLHVDPADPVFIVAAKNYKIFQTLEPANYLAKGQLKLAGLFLKTQDRNYVLLCLDAAQDHPFATVYHEYTHLQFSSASDWMPLWLDEGLAEFMQNTDIREKDVHLGQPSLTDILMLRQGQLIPLTALFGVNRESPYYHEESKGSIFYSEAWALTHYLEVNDRIHHTHQLDTYLGLVSKHEDPVTAAQKAFGDIKQLEAALNVYIRGSAYKEFILSSVAAPIDPAKYRVLPLSTSESDAIRADFLASVGRKADALALLDAALLADPNNAQALETHGYIAFRDGDQETARTWYEKAVKADSQSYLAHYYFAAMSMHGKANQTESADEVRIESSLRRSIQLNPAFAPAYDALAILLAEQRKNLDEAHTLSLKAIHLDRSNLAYRINTSTILMAMGKYADATETLRMARSLAKGPNDQALIDADLAAAQRMQDAGAHVTLTTAVSDGTTNVEVLRTIDAEVQPKHPREEPTGPIYEALGVILHAQCISTSELDFQLHTAKKTLSFFHSDYFKLDLTALGFEPKAEMNPCKDIEGFKARVRYAVSSDSSVDGQVVSIELRK